MPLGLKNGSAIFQIFISDLMRDFIRIKNIVVERISDNILEINMKKCVLL